MAPPTLLSTDAQHPRLNPLPRCQRHKTLPRYAPRQIAHTANEVSECVLPTSWLDGLVNGGSQHQVPVRGLGTGEHQASQLGQSTTQGGGEHHVAAIGGDLQSSHNNDVDSVTDQKKTPPNKVSK